MERLFVQLRYDICIVSGILAVFRNCECGSAFFCVRYGFEDGDWQHYREKQETTELLWNQLQSLLVQLRHDICLRGPVVRSLDSLSGR